MEAKDIKKNVVKQMLGNVSNEDIKIMISELKHWHTKGVLVKDGLVLKFQQTLNGELEKTRTWTEVHLDELNGLIIWEVAERFCKLND